MEDHHYSLGLFTLVSCGLRSRTTADSDLQFFFLWTRAVRRRKLHSAYKLAKALAECVPPRNKPCNCRPLRRAQVQCMSIAWTLFSTYPTLAEFRGLWIWRYAHHWYQVFYKLNETWNVLQKVDDNRALSNADTKYNALTHISALKTTQNEFKWQHCTCLSTDWRHSFLACLSLYGQVTQSGRLYRYRWLISYRTPLSDGTPAHIRIHF